MTRTKLGFANYMVGSNIEATRYSGINHAHGCIILIYALSGAMCALAGIIMMARFNSVRVGHGEFYLLITVLACFLGGVNPFGGFGKVVIGVPRARRFATLVFGTQSAGRQPAPGHGHLGHHADRRHDPAVGWRAAQFQ